MVDTGTHTGNAPGSEALEQHRESKQWIGHQWQESAYGRWGDHDMRTPLCAVREEDGTFTMIYTAKMKNNGFSAVGKCTLGWAAE